MGPVARTDNDIAGYAAIAVAIGISIEDAWSLVIELDREKFHSSGRALALSVATEAKRRVTGTG